VGPASASTTGTTIDATKEVGEPNHAGNSGGRSIWYRITPASNGTVTIDTAGSNFDTLLAAYTGSSVSLLTQVAANDDTTGLGLQSRVQFAGTAGVTYNIAVDGYGGASGAVTLNWVVAAAPPPPPPSSLSVSIADASILEGRKKQTMSFTVSLSSVSAVKVTVSYATANGTAVSPSDYTAKSGTVSINAGATSAVVKISIIGDRVKEPDETFTVTLTNPTGGAVLARAIATGTIRNDD
ncbi:MAG: Calx-beta domain-containing protein, partial [Acidimicrobiia bacterium]